MHSTKLRTRTYLWSFLLGLFLLPHTLQADSAPSTPAVTSIILPQAYRVLCEADPSLRPTLIQPYIAPLRRAGQLQYQVFLNAYQAQMEKLIGPVRKGAAPPGTRYPLYLAWVHPTTEQRVYFEASLYDEASDVQDEGITIIDHHTPVLMTVGQVYRARGQRRPTLKAAWEEFLKRNPYPAGDWESKAHVAGDVEMYLRWRSTNDSTLSPELMLQQPPALRFQDQHGVLTDCAQRNQTVDPYAITKLSDPKLQALHQLTQRVQALRAHPLQQGARLTYLEPPKDHSGLTEAVVFVDPKTFSGYLLSPTMAGALQGALTDKDPKRSLDTLYELAADPGQFLAFSSYKDLSKRFFYREVFSKEAVLDPKEELDLREQKGWEQWRKDAKKELSAITAFVDESGCIRGKWRDGKDFKVCGTRAPGTKGSSKSQTVTFSRETDKGTKIIGHAQVGQTLHSERGVLLDENNRKVAYVPLESTSIFDVLPRAITLVVYSLPHDAFQAVADVFSFQGLWDLTKSLVGGVVRRFISNCLGVGWLNDLYNAVRAVESGYQMGMVFTQFWDRVYDAKDEYELYDAADGARPAVQALIRKAVQDKLVEKAQGKIRELEKDDAPKPSPSGPKQQLALPGPTPPYGLLTTSEVEGLVLNSNEKYPLTEANAQALLIGPTPTSTYELTIPKDEHGVEIVFQDQGKTALSRIVTSVDEVGKKFAKPFEERLLEGARQKGEDGPRELVVQVHDGQDVAGALQHFRKEHTGKKWLEKFQGEDLVVVDPAHKELYHGPVLATGPSPPRTEQEAPVNPDPKNRVQLEKLKHKLRIIMEKPHVEDPELADIMTALWKPGAKVGNRSTAAAVRQELRSGERVGEKIHFQKALNKVTELEKWLKKNPKARLGDRAAAENVLQDLRDALEGK